MGPTIWYAANHDVIGTYLDDDELAIRWDPDRRLDEQPLRPRPCRKWLGYPLLHIRRHTKGTPWLEKACGGNCSSYGFVPPYRNFRAANLPDKALFGHQALAGFSPPTCDGAANLSREAWGSGLTRCGSFFFADFGRGIPAFHRWHVFVQRKIAEMDDLISRAKKMKLLLQRADRCKCLDLEDYGKTFLARPVKKR